jgi:hypothetical protein
MKTGSLLSPLLAVNFFSHHALAQPAARQNDIRTHGVFETVPDTFSGKEWLASHKNKLRKEEDVIASLMLLNTEEKAE